MWIIKRTSDRTYFSGFDCDEVEVFSYQSSDAIQFHGSDKMRIKLYPGEEWEEVSDVGH